MCPVTQNEQMIRCVVAHDIAWLRQGVRRLLDDEPDITVVAEAEDAVQTLRHVSRTGLSSWSSITTFLRALQSRPSG